MKNSRSSNIELLRIFSMLLIIAHHYACHGGVYYNVFDGMNGLIASFLIIGGKLGVSLFIMITGYFLAERDFKWSRLLKLEGEVLFYSIIGFFLGCFIFHTETVSVTSLKNNLLPSLMNQPQQYWFIPCYFAVLIFSPFINAGIQKLSLKEYRILLGVMILLGTFVPMILNSNTWFDGSFFIFVLMYLIGAYIKRDVEGMARMHSSLCLVGSVILYCAIAILVFKFHTPDSNKDGLWGMNSFFIIVLSILIFTFFVKLQMGSISWINTIASTTIGIYLIHDNCYVRDILWTKLLSTERFYESPYLVLHAVICIVIVFIGACGIDMLRKLIIKGAKCEK